MGFFTERCPNCGKNISKNAEYCSSCGCPTAGSWATCNRCKASVGSESRFCWKCGAEQNPESRPSAYGFRWQRSPFDFAMRVDLAVPEQILQPGIQIDDGTLALLFQDGQYKGMLQPGYYSTDAFFQGLPTVDRQRAAHATILDMQGAEIDFLLENVRVKEQVPIDVRVRLLFRIREPKLFVDTVLQSASTFSTKDLTDRFRGDVTAAVQQKLAGHSADELMVEVRARELLEADLVAQLAPVLSARGLEIVGVRLADFGGQAIEYIREKLGDLGKITREFEINRKLRDALRDDKAAAFRGEQQLNDYYEQVTTEFGFKSAERDQERQRFTRTTEHRSELEGLRQDYEKRRSEILNRLDEQKLRHQDELVEVHHELEVGRLRFNDQIESNRVRFEESLQQQDRQFGLGQEMQVKQAHTDLEVARAGVEALKLVKEAKHELRAKEEDLNTRLEAERLKNRGEASMQALLASMSGEQADRLLKLAELEMRKGLSVEQALALVVEKSPEIAPAIAAALKAKYAGSNPE